LRPRLALLGVALAGLMLVSAVLVLRAPAGPGPSGASSATASSESTKNGHLKGLTFTPDAYDQQGLSDYFSRARQAGGLITWAGDWDALSDPGSAPYVLEAQAKQDDLTLLPELQVLNSSSGQLLRPLTSGNEENYEALAVSFAKAYKPPYIALGVEVNLLYEKAPTDFQTFVSFFNATRTAIRVASPGTAVFTIFQLEKMKGLDGGLFGGANDAADSEWGILSDFPSSDLVGFTTYPGLVYHSASSLPGDYYSQIAQHTQKPIAFTEVGWQSGSLPGWDNNETSQAGFVKAFFGLTSGLPKALVVWAFAYDQRTSAPFDSMGLINSDGTEKQAWTAWMEDG
jgi:hypothetical protein